MSNWLKDAVFYEIYPQSFMDTNCDGIGDLQGIIAKLDYIKELGCDSIWINPCFTSPFGDAGYDISDYYTIAPRYGTNEDAKQLFEEAHKRGMHILLDLVPGHTSVEHPWFKASCKAEKNEFTDRYIWTDSIWESPEPMGSLRGISERSGSAAVNFFSFQPALNYGYYIVDKPWQQSMEDEGPLASLNEMMNIMRFWLTLGCDGFRVDMAHSMVKGDPESKGTILFWKKVRKFLEEEFPQAVMVSEWGEPDKSLQGGFHMDFLLHFGPSHYNDLFRCDTPYFSREGKGDVKEFVDKYLETYAKAERKGLICIPSGNHDMARISDKLDQEEIKIAFAFLLSMPGAPFIYYGDEIGMRYLGELVSKEGGYERTGARTPMQWDTGINAGFSSAAKEKLYLPQDENADRPNAKTQMEKEDSLWKEVQKLIGIRRQYKALQNYADIEFVYVEKDSYPLAYLRKEGEEKVLVVINPAAKDASFSYDAKVKEVLFGYGKEVTCTNGMVSVPGESAAYLLLE